MFKVCEPTVFYGTKSPSMPTDVEGVYTIQHGSYYEIILKPYGTLKNNFTDYADYFIQVPK